jgi:hypothetical protein
MSLIQHGLEAPDLREDSDPVSGNYGSGLTDQRAALHALKVAPAFAHSKKPAVSSGFQRGG